MRTDRHVCDFFGENFDGISDGIFGNFPMKSMRVNPSPPANRSPALAGFTGNLRNLAGRAKHAGGDRYARVGGGKHSLALLDIRCNIDATRQCRVCSRLPSGFASLILGQLDTASAPRMTTLLPTALPRLPPFSPRSGSDAQGLKSARRLIRPIALGQARKSTHPNKA